MDKSSNDLVATPDEPTPDPHCPNCKVEMKKAEDFGTNSDGSRSEEYCCHCMQGGILY